MNLQIASPLCISAGPRKPKRFAYLACGSAAISSGAKSATLFGFSRFARSSSFFTSFSQRLTTSARIRQITRNGAANQRWLIKRMKFTKHSTIPSVIRGQMHRYLPTVLRVPEAAYSVIADHSGLCLDIVSGSTRKSSSSTLCSG